MSTIMRTHVLGNKDADEFHRQVLVVINEFQDVGLDVEIQYSAYSVANTPVYTAFIIGREKQ